MPSRGSRCFNQIETMCLLAGLLVLGPDALLARQELSLSHLTEIQQAQLALDFIGEI